MISWRYRNFLIWKCLHKCRINYSIISIPCVQTVRARAHESTRVASITKAINNHLLLSRLITIINKTGNPFFDSREIAFAAAEKISYRGFSSLTYNVVRLLHHGRLRRIHNRADAAATRDCVLAASYSHPRAVPGQIRQMMVGLRLYDHRWRSCEKESGFPDLAIDRDLYEILEIS